MTTAALPSAPVDAPWRAGLDAARRLVGPALVLQAAAAALVLTYYFVPAAQGAFAALASVRDAGGYAYSALSTALFGGLLPFLYLRVNRHTRVTAPWRHLWFFLAFWAWKGAETDLWYRLLGGWLGHDASLRTVAAKVLIDQFLFNTLYTSPIGAICFAWKDAGYRWAPVAADLRAGRWYARRILPIVIAVWAVWIPVVCCVFALPAALQIPLFNIVLCFWSMLYASLTHGQNRGAAAGA